MNAIERITAELSHYAGEQVKVEEISGNIYAFGSELATLRLFAKYNANVEAHNNKVRVGYSKNMRTHYFKIESCE